MGATWRIRTAEGSEQVWNWEVGAPPVEELVPVRRPAADAMSRHAPVRMSCQTTGSWLLLESGMEYEAGRELDRDPTVDWIVAQPVRLQFDHGPTHIVDLLARHRDGSVVLWDVRPDERQDDEFGKVAKLTRRACQEMGWDYAVHGTSSTARRLNLLWLGTFRRPPRWPHHRIELDLLSLASGSATIGDLMATDDGNGHAIATMWHLLWTGALRVDLDEKITRGTTVTVAELQVSADA